MEGVETTLVGERVSGAIAEFCGNAQRPDMITCGKLGADLL